jgi:hypothetical protein
MFQQGVHNQAVTTSTFDKRLLIEQIRYLEAEHPFVCENDETFSDHSAHKDFEQRLWQRAQCLVDQYDLSALLGRAARLAWYAKVIALLLAALCGALGIVYAITDSYTINIYWLLLVLLGFNLISMLLWLTGISLNIKGLTSGMLARLTSWLPAHLESRFHSAQLASARSGKLPGTQADRAWLACCFSGRVGKWQFSKLTHQLWLVYLLTGLLSLLLLLMVRQYDFVWGTTLLSDNAFVKLTDVLSVPLQGLGFATPTAEQVQQSRIGLLQADVLQVLNAEHRYVWAQFLLGALLLFGIVPRLLLWVWSALMYRLARRVFTLDFYLPYYITLRQHLMPLASHGQIIDADTAPPVIAKSPAVTPLPHALPAQTQWVAVELGAGLNWPPESINMVNDLGQVTDRESLSRILQQLQANKSPVVAVAVSSARSPDRGVQRTIASLLANSEQRWLVLLQQNEGEVVSPARLASWYRLAEACSVPADHVISMSMV